DDSYLDMLDEAVADIKSTKPEKENKNDINDSVSVETVVETVPVNKELASKSPFSGWVILIPIVLLTIVFVSFLAIRYSKSK
ncbi:unnamed protein product, partial [marine sediment metagenome]